MTSVEFCYWIQGLFELADPKSLDEHQTELIKRHLQMVFVHEIDPSYADREKLNAIHAEPVKKKPSPPAPPPPSPVSFKSPMDVMVRC